MNLSRDEQMARLSLTMDERELANLAAENSKYERRKQAMRKGDSGSPVEPVFFIHQRCVTCSVILTTMNHSASMLCHACVAHEAKIQHTAEANARFLIAQAKVVAGQKRDARKRFAFWAMMAAGLGAIVAWALDKAFFAAGSAL